MNTDKILDELGSIYHHIMYHSSLTDDYTKIHSLLDEMCYFVQEERCVDRQPTSFKFAELDSYDF